MDNKDLKALNEKLLEFAGFKPCTYNGTNEIIYSSSGYILWDNPSGVYIGITDFDLVNDANAQIKWLYPKLMDYAFGWDYDPATLKYLAYIDGRFIICCMGESNDSPTLAFALAVEKLIDYLEKTK